MLKLGFLKPNFFATHCSRPKVFQIMNFIESNHLTLKYHRFTAQGCKDLGIRKFEFFSG